MKRFFFPFFLILVFLQGCTVDSSLEPTPSRLEKEKALSQLSFEEIESAYLQEIGSRACVQLLGSNYNVEQLAVALKYFKVLEEIVGSPWVGITDEIKMQGNNGRIFRMMCLG